jgi:two-component system chemotaxis response regulator CheB
VISTQPKPTTTSIDAAAEPIRVLLCDDSAVIRSILDRTLREDPALRVVGRVGNGQEAIDAVKAGGIDVVVLDIEMPVMDGMTALPHLLAADRGIKILMSSTLTTVGAAIALEALKLGAADFVPKPTSVGNIAGDGGFRAELLAKVKGLGRLRRRQIPRPAATPRESAAAGATPLARPAVSRSLVLRAPPRLPPTVLAIGGSTGGPAALFSLFQALGDRVAVPIVLTQHMPATFTPMLAAHITKLGGVSCAEAKDGDLLQVGRVLLAPGDRHLTITGTASRASVLLTSDPPENFCRPAVDPMLRSLSAVFPGRVLVVMLTGMGQDGLKGSETVVAAGGSVIAQDEASSVVWGMPGAVAQAGLCQAILPLSTMAAKILQIVGRRGA